VAKDHATIERTSFVIYVLCTDRAFDGWRKAPDLGRLIVVDSLEQTNHAPPMLLARLRDLTERNILINRAANWPMLRSPGQQKGSSKIQ
jgi:hypothetical protein